MSHRILYWDITKSFAISLVVWGHCLQNMTQDSDYFSSCLTCEVIISFHMALFMMVSGYFAYSSLSKPFDDVMKRRVFQLLLPSITWYLIIRSIALISSKQFLSLYGIKELINGCFTSLWFLKALFSCYLIVMIGSALYKRKKSLFLIYIIWVFAFGKYLNYNNTISMLPFFLGGLLLHKYDDWIFHHAVPILTLSCTTWMSILFFFDISDYSIYHHPFAYNGMSIFAILLRTIVGFSGSMTILLLIKNMCEHRQSFVINVLAKIGGMTLGIYCIQVLFAEIGNRIFAPYLDLLPRILYDFIITPFYSIAVIVLCYYIIIQLRKNKHIRLLLLGEK